MAIVKRDDQSLFSPEKSSLENIAFKKSGKAVGNCFGKGRFLLPILLGKEGGVELHFVNKLIDRPVGRVD